jgi:O-antigen/teichoic acid export membrane protein
MNQAWIRLLPTAIRNRLTGRHSLQKVIGNTGWLFFDNILRIGVGFLVSIWVTRYLGPEQFGQLNYAIAFVGFFSSIAILGLDGIVVRSLVRNPDQKEEILGSAFVLKLAGGLAMTAITIASIFIVRHGDFKTTLLVTIISLSTIFQAFGTIDFWFQSQTQSKFCAITRSVTFLLISGIKVLLITVNAPLSTFAWTGLAEVILGSLGLVVAYRLTGFHLTALHATQSMAKELIKDSWPLIFADIATAVFMRADKIILGETVGNQELGIYCVAVMLTETLWLIPRALSSSIYPGLIEAKNHSEELFHQRIQQFYNLMAFYTYSVALPSTLLGSWLVPLLFGPAYASAGIMLAGLVWSGMFINMGFARSCYLTTMNWTRLHSTTDVIGCIVNVGLNLILIPRYGGMGAVVASLISYWLAVHGSCYLFRPLHKTGQMMTKAMLYPKFW